MIAVNEGARLVFLLVGEDLDTGVEEAQELETRISVNGGAFVATANEAQEIGGGWYFVDLEPSETATVGPLVFVARSPDAAVEWRNLYEVGERSLGLDEEALAAALAEAIEAALGEWEIALRVPVRLIRAGAMG